MLPGMGKNHSLLSRELVKEVGKISVHAIYCISVMLHFASFGQVIWWMFRYYTRLPLFTISFLVVSILVKNSFFVGIHIPLCTTFDFSLPFVLKMGQHAVR